MISIHQLLAGFMPGDAISNYALILQKIFRLEGHDSEIFVPPAYIDARARKLCHPLDAHSRFSSKENILIYHFSIGSDATGCFLNAVDHKIVIYHNVTPPRYFYPFNPLMARLLEEGRRQLHLLIEVTELALGVSEYNRRELEDAGFARTGIVPLTIDWSGLDGPPSPAVLMKYGPGRDHILFVGRIAPNKKIEDLLQVFFYYRPVKPGSRLFIAGNYEDNEGYYLCLVSLAQKLSLEGVVFTGHITLPELLAYYRLACVFLCLSEHEGFCLPLLESMHFGIPVLAYAAAAVPDTLNGAGVLIREKNFPAIAEMAALLTEEGQFRRAILAGQRRRLAEFKSVSVEQMLKKHLAPWL